MKKYLIYTLPIFTILGVSLFFWQFYQTKAKAARVESEILKELSAQDIRSILTSSPATATIADEPESQRLFLKGLREYLALAAEARREGLADDPRFTLNFEYKKALLLADAFEQRSLTNKNGPLNPSPTDMELFWSDSSNETKFRETMKAIASIQQDVEKQRGSDIVVPGLTGEAMEKARRNFSRAHILAAKAKAESDFVDSREIQLRLKILEAGILSSDFLCKHWAANITATEAEMQTYLADHPEYHAGRKEDLAKNLLSRIKAGEDFASIARAESEDRTSKLNGGLYENISTDLVWPEVEKAALSMESGNVFPELIKTNTGFHIVKLERKAAEKGDGKGGVKFSFRHILIQFAFEDPHHHVPEVPAPFVDARTIAKKAIETQKRDLFVSSVLARAGIIVPESL